jgi:glycosyltransferase involved in cell wall biosynthesis
MGSIEQAAPQMPLKVVWLCHGVGLDIEVLLNMKDGSPRMTNIAPWIPNTLKTLSGERRISLYVVAPAKHLTTPEQRVKVGSIEYHFFKPFERFLDENHSCTILKKIRTLLNLLLPINRWFDFPINKMRVKRIVGKIEPDIIHLQGAENSYYSATILPFAGKYPIIVTIQGFISHSRERRTRRMSHGIKIERAVIQKFKHFGIRTAQMGKDVRTINPQAELHWLYYTVPQLSVLDVEKTHDLVFYARICKDKGIEDLILALKQIKDNYREVTLLVLGPESSPAYMAFLKQLAEENGVGSSISWLGYQSSQNELFRKASAAKVSVLPTHHDIIPGTIIESLQLGLPVVSYNVGSISELNEEVECVLLVERGDVKGLAREVIKLLSNDDLYQAMRNRGVKCMQKRYQGRNVTQQHLDVYSEVIKDFYSQRHK